LAAGNAANRVLFELAIMMLDLHSVLVETHRRNLDRYFRLLATELTTVEREYIHKRIAEERAELDRLLAAQRLPNFSQTDDMAAVDPVPVSNEGGAPSPS
jgi:hypothetical protein